METYILRKQLASGFLLIHAASGICIAYPATEAEAVNAVIALAGRLRTDDYPVRWLLS